MLIRPGIRERSLLFFSVTMKLRRATLVLSLMLLALPFQNCSDKSFSTSAVPSSQNNGNGGNNNGNGGDDAHGNIPQNCQDQLQQITVPVKMLFVVDVSGSNASNPGTDPNKVVRGGSIQEFFNLYGTKPNFWWGFTYFAGTTSSALIGYNNDASQPAFTNNPTDMLMAIQVFLNQIGDSGNTPYVAALDLAIKAIQNDTVYTPDTSWVVVWLSDGMPVPDVNNAILTSKVQTLIGLRPGKVTFNAVYYGPLNPTASGRLQMMTMVGGGKFLDTNANPNGKSFQIVDVINVPGTICK